MKLIIVSGRSGSGKTTCLHLLEDLEYYCVDNIPASLLPALAKRLSDERLHLARVAVSTKTAPASGPCTTLSRATSPA